MTNDLLIGSFRILDASVNRASEGLRTLEEFARFVLEDRNLSGLVKSLRHDLRLAIESLPLSDRLAARAVASDCGTTIELDSERERSDALSVASAAAARAQEAVRCIEEYGKTVAHFDSRAIESIRYRLYTVSAAICLTPSRKQRFEDARLYLLLPCDESVDRFAGTVETLFTSGVDIIQLRDKQADDRQLYRCAKVASDLARRLGKCFIVNDRADIAAATHASGVHVGQEELPVEAVRRVIGTSAIIGVSTHSLDQAKAAVLDGADYIGCGPTFPSQTKSFAEFPGLAFLREVASQITLPAFAIGGIDESNVDSVMNTGIHGVAVSSAIMAKPDPLAAATALKKAVSR